MRFISRGSRFLAAQAANLLSLLFPVLCCGCEKPLNKGEDSICSSCLYHIPHTDHHLDKENRVARLFWGKIPFHAAMALLRYRKGSRVQRIIYNLKYKGWSELGIVLGRMMARQLLKCDFHSDIDLVIPVPLHKSKERKRGYNQSLLIANGLANVLGIPVNGTILYRKSATESQTRKGRYSRHENMADAFRIRDGETLSGKHILIVDDVVTTGATITACVLEMQSCGLRKLSIAVAACAE
jgi:ComF family protein